MYTAISVPAPAQPAMLRDLIFASVALGMPKPDIVDVQGGRLVFAYETDPKIGQQLLDSWAALIATNPQPATAPWRVQDTIQVRMQTALDTNTTFLNVVSPSNAQVVAQVKALTRQASALVRMQLGQFDTTSGT